MCVCLSREEAGGGGLAARALLGGSRFSRCPALLLVRMMNAGKGWNGDPRFSPAGTVSFAAEIRHPASVVPPRGKEAGFASSGSSVLGLGGGRGYCKQVHGGCKSGQEASELLHSVRSFPVPPPHSRGGLASSNPRGGSLHKQTRAGV